MAKENSQKRPVRAGLISLGCAKNLVDAEVMLGILGAAGWEVVSDPAEADAIILNTRWDGAGTNIYGFAVGPEAVAAASGLPMIDPGVASMLAGSRVITLPDLGLSVQLNTWGSLSSRSAWASVDVMFGAALGDNTAGAHVKSA